MGLGGFGRPRCRCANHIDPCPQTTKVPFVGNVDRCQQLRSLGPLFLEVGLFGTFLFVFGFFRKQMRQRQGILGQDTIPQRHHLHILWQPIQEMLHKLLLRQITTTAAAARASLVTFFFLFALRETHENRAVGRICINTKKKKERCWCLFFFVGRETHKLLQVLFLHCIAYLVVCWHDDCSCRYR